MQTTEILQEVREFWQPFYLAHSLTDEEASEMVETVGAVFDLLYHWSPKNQTTGDKEKHVEQRRRTLVC